jgi:signal transduction histidine kinase
MEAAADRTTIRAAESRIEFALAGVFSILIGGTLWYVHSLFAEIAPLGRLWLWTGMVIAVTVVMAAVPLIVHLRRSSDAEIMRIWAPAGKVIAVAFDLAVASSVWLLLPYASEPLRLLMVVFYAAVISGQVISTAESTGTIIFGVVSIFGSAAAFFLMTPGLYSVGVALFLLGFGALMIGVAAVLKVAIRSAIQARLNAEAISASLAEALDQATEARNSKTRFIAAATHDLRQPLQAAALFFNRAVGPDRAVQEQAVASARLAFEEAASLLDRLLDHLRLDGGLIQPAMQDVALAPLLARVRDEVAPLAAANGFALRLAPTRLSARGDPHLILRILRNLLHNAIRHSRGRGILIGARSRGGRVHILVLDDGRGIPADAAEALFAEEKLLQSPARGGVGLGLPSSRRLAELMEGAVAHLPRWRRGAAFSLELSGTGDRHSFR